MLRVRPNPVSFGAEFVVEGASPAGQIAEIYDSRGRLVDVVKSGAQGKAAWHAGNNAPSGIYFARLKGAGSPGGVRFLVVR